MIAGTKRRQGWVKFKAERRVSFTRNLQPQQPPAYVRHLKGRTGFVLLPDCSCGLGHRNLNTTQIHINKGPLEPEQPTHDEGAADDDQGHPNDGTDYSEREHYTQDD